MRRTTRASRAAIWKALHRRLSAVYFIPETICRVAASKGIELDPRVLGSTSRELKLRMASIRLDPKTHPIAGDTRLKLLCQRNKSVATGTGSESQNSRDADARGSS